MAALAAGDARRASRNRARRARRASSCSYPCSYRARARLARTLSSTDSGRGSNPAGGILGFEAMPVWLNHAMRGVRETRGMPFWWKKLGCFAKWTKWPDGGSPDEVTYHRGEVEVTVFRLGRAEPWERWGYEGMVGRASLPRVLEIAGEKLLADDAVLRGDADYFDRLAQENRRLDEAWTAYYSGTGPRPATGRLP